MAISACLKCGGQSFEIVANTPTGSVYAMSFVQRAACGTVVGVTGAYNTANLLKQQDAVLEDLRRRLERIEHHLAKPVAAALQE